MKAVLLIVLFALFVILAALNVRRIVLFSVAAMLIVIPIANAAFMPRSVFGVTGLNIANIIWFFAFIVVSLAKLNKKGSLRLRSYLLLPVSVFLGLYLIATIWSIIDIRSIQSLLFQITRVSLILENIIKPIQFFLAGWIVMAACELEGSRNNIQRAIYIIPLILAPVQLYYFFIGGSAGMEYSEGREVISTSIGYHANELGAVGTYLLAIILLNKEDSWHFIRYIAIGASLLIVTVSFSRMAYVTTIILFAVVFFKLSAKEKTALISMAAVVILVFSAQLVNRIYFGVDDRTNDADINTVSAGRIDGIWKPLIPHITENIILGSGVYGLLKAGPVSRGMPKHPHNAYMQVLLDLGIIGLLALFWMLLRFISEDKRANKTFRYLVMCWMLMGLTGHSFYPIYANFLVWVGYGMMLAAQKENMTLSTKNNENSRVNDYSTRLVQVKSS